VRLVSWLVQYFFFAICKKFLGFLKKKIFKTSHQQKKTKNKKLPP